MTLSVALCTYNGERFLPDQLRSLRDQTRPPDEVVVCDDASSDRSAAEGFGRIVEAPEVLFEKMNEEHGFVDARTTDRKWRVGEKVRVIPNHICVAVNLHERIYGCRGEDVVEVWEVEGRGKLQ